jgi:hypothetical protein
MPIRRSPNGTGYTRPQPGRDRSEQVVAINRNAWSQSIGISGRNQPVRAPYGRRRRLAYPVRGSADFFLRAISSTNFFSRPHGNPRFSLFGKPLARPSQRGRTPTRKWPFFQLLVTQLAGTFIYDLS